MKQKMLGFEFSSTLDEKTSELCMLAASLAFNCSGCTRHHAEAARAAGADEDEIRHVIALTMRVGAGRVKSLATETLEIREEK